MGFKTWSVGDILTASDTNNYLMKQVVIVCTSGTRPSSPVAGMTIYETDTDLYRRWNGSAWVINIMPLAAYKTADTARVNNTLTADPHLTIPVSANAVYLLHLSASWNAHASGDFGWDFTIPTAATLDQYRHIANDGTATAVGGVTLNATSLQGRSGNSVDAALILEGTLITAANAGSCTWRWAQITTFGTGTTVFKGSSMTLTRIS